jgi:hypothetical protein
MIHDAVRDARICRRPCVKAKSVASGHARYDRAVAVEIPV